MTADWLIKELPKGLIKWYDFIPGAAALYITSGSELDEALIEALRESNLKVDAVQRFDVFKKESVGKYDYAFASDVLECCMSEKEGASLLEKTCNVLKPDGRLLICADNRLAVKYFCGDRDPYTDRNFDGVEDYRNVLAMDKKRVKGRLYSKSQLTDMLKQAGICRFRFYSVFPDIRNPQLLLAEDYMPTEELDIRIFPQYNFPGTVFLEEEKLYTQFARNHILHAMADGFLIECPKRGDCANIKQVTVSMCRGRENAMATIIRRDGNVEKRPLYQEGAVKADRLQDSNAYLMEHGVKMISAEKRGNALVMPYVTGRPLVAYFRDLLRTDTEKFVNELDRLWKTVLDSSKHVSCEEVDWEHFDPRWAGEEKKYINRSRWRRIAFGTKEEREALGPILERGYIDLVILNGFEQNGRFVFYDQEMYIENMPAKVIILRSIGHIYYGDSEAERILPMQTLFERYNLTRYADLFYAFETFYLDILRNDRLLDPYYIEHRADKAVLNSNRQRMNYSEEEYRKLFAEAFEGLRGKKLYLFGAGSFAKRFLALYGDRYEISGILDNDEDKWGAEISGIRVTGADVLKGLDPGAYKVIICMKNYTGVLRQVRALGAVNIGIYDKNIVYPQKNARVPSTSGQTALPVDSGVIPEKKKYRTGYIAGVFDLFHVGHLNLLRRAKEQCDYLIVGVVTDEAVQRDKHTESFISFEERLAIVRACRYVDEAVEIPLMYNDTQDAYMKYQFDVQFSGSDYADDPRWLKKRDFLRKHGAELVFFPYTESTSSTKIKEMIDRKLM